MNWRLWKNELEVMLLHAYIAKKYVVVCYLEVTAVAPC